MDLPKKALGQWCVLVPDFKTSSKVFYSAVQKAVLKYEFKDLAFSEVKWAEGGLLSANRVYLRVSRGRLRFDICAAPAGSGYFFSWWMTAKGPAFWLLFSSAFLFMFLLPLFAVSVAVQSASHGVSTLTALAMGVGYGSAFLAGMGAFICGTLVMLYLLHSGAENGLEDAMLETPVLGRLYVMLFDPDTFYKHDTAAVFRECVRAAFHEVLDKVREEHGLRALQPYEKIPRLRDLSR